MSLYPGSIATFLSLYPCPAAAGTDFPALDCSYYIKFDGTNYILWKLTLTFLFLPRASTLSSLTCFVECPFASPSVGTNDLFPPHFIIFSWQPITVVRHSLSRLMGVHLFHFFPVNIQIKAMGEPWAWKISVSKFQGQLHTRFALKRSTITYSRTPRLAIYWVNLQTTPVRLPHSLRFCKQQTLQQITSGPFDSVTSP